MVDLLAIEKTMTQSAKEIMESGQDLMPVCFVITPSGEASIMGLAYRNDREKHLAYEAVSQMAQKLNAIAVISITDAWTLWIPKDIDLDTVPRPSESPERKEALVVSVILPDGTISSFSSYPYERESDRIAWLTHDAEKVPDAARSEQNLLPPWGSLGATQ